MYVGHKVLNAIAMSAAALLLIHAAALMAMAFRTLVGCIHLPSSASICLKGEVQLTNECGVIILLYSRGKQGIIGFVPNEMEEFVRKLLEIVPNHGVSSNKEEHAVSGEVNGGKREGEQMAIEEQERSETQKEDEASMDTTTMENERSTYWNHELSSSYNPTAFLAVNSQQEFLKDVKSPTFFKGCKWAPDGSCLISNSDDDVLRLFNVPETLHKMDWERLSEETLENEQIEIESVLKIKEGGQVYDYCWYPLMSSYDPVSCCFLTTSSDSPVHLWDAFSGKLRASYLPYDHLDQVVAARTVAFDPTGESIHCGFDTMIRTFNVTRPGRQCQERKLKHLEIPELSQPGIVSCISINPVLKSVMAVGSYLKTVGLYHDDGSVLCILQGHLGGVTHLQFSHDGTKLFSGGRKDSRLICWDMRQMGDTYTIFDRIVKTNQRIYFDISKNDKYLVSGGTDGFVKIWDLMQPSTSSFKANDDCVNGVSINPFIPVLATTSGQRHMPTTDFSDDENETSETPSRKKGERDIKLWNFC